VSLRALSIDSQCTEAFRYQILELLCKDGRYNDAAEAISNLLAILEKNEPNNHALFFDYSKVFARVCGKNPIVLQETEKYLEKSIGINQKICIYFIELGTQKLSQNKVKEASKCFSSALHLDGDNIPAMIGHLKCKLAQDRVEDVGQELELLTETQPTINTFPEFPYLKAMYNKKRNVFEKNMKLIDEAITVHFKALKGLPLGKNYFFNLNPDFVLELVKEYMAFTTSTVSFFKLLIH
jgi:tetratricopeptide repeat protein 21B